MGCGPADASVLATQPQLLPMETSDRKAAVWMFEMK